MRGIILQDIDNVSYPFKELHTQFLLHHKLISQRLADRFLSSKMPYLIDFLLVEELNGNCTEKDTFSLRKTYGERAKEFERSLIERKTILYENEALLKVGCLFFATFNDFRNSEFFYNGSTTSVVGLNKKIKKEYPGIKIIGITARGTHVGKDTDEFREIYDLTHRWNAQKQVGLDEIFFEKNKIRVYEEIIKSPQYSGLDVLCFVEDDPKNIEPFLKRSVPCVLIEFSHYGQESLVERLKNDYSSRLFLAENHDDASRVIEALLEKSFS